MNMRLFHEIPVSGNLEMQDSEGGCSGCKTESCKIKNEYEEQLRPDWTVGEVSLLVY